MKTIPLDKIYQYQELKKKESEAYHQVAIASRITNKAITKIEWPIKNPSYDPNDERNDGPWGGPPEMITEFVQVGISMEIKEAVVQLLEKQRQDITKQIEDLCITVEKDK